MDRRGQLGTLGFSVIVAVMLFMVGMLTINLLTPQIDQTRLDLSCSTPGSISDGTKLTCLITDGVIPYFFVIVMAAAGGFVTNKILI